ncbi:MAG: tRNA preQ1(34) S-adenosylmethionine ribosyltransferase-isomerase QueA [Myxococcota bacterium]|nr:tRNA preQ1(34) S-adenosylmethionine ribosyltransferase-isomerase QueA [Myxococcota bacterium]
MSELDPRLRPFDYALPEPQIARHPPKSRDGGRLLLLGASQRHDRQITDLASCLSPGDLLVVNNTRVLAARLAARRGTGGAVEVLLLSDAPGADGCVPAMVRPGRRLKAGESLELLKDGVSIPGLSVVLSERLPDGTWRVRPLPGPGAVMSEAGALPLPPYFRRDFEADDAWRYQTVFAGPPGAIAAPTAGLHLSEDILDALDSRGVHRAHITLHVGPGTFRNLRSADLDAGMLHQERFSVPVETAEAVNCARAEGRRVVAVGTTSTRCLESAAVDGMVQPGEGSTRLFIQPGYRFSVVDRLLTNFHLPRSSLLMLACAFGGQERVMAAYQHAITTGYRFYSYGDAMLMDCER